MNSTKIVPAVAWRRIGAFLIDLPIVVTADLFILLAIILGAVTLAGINISDRSALDQFSTTYQSYLLLGVSVAFAVGYWLYSAPLESSRWQATIGKRILGIYVTDANGNRIGFGKASLRVLTKVLCGSVPFAFSSNSFFQVAAVINLGMVLLTDRHQGIHDKVARTFVVERKVEMPKITIDRRTYNVSGRDIIVTGDNVALTNVNVGGNTNSDLTPESLAAFSVELEKVRGIVEAQPLSNDRDIASSILKAAENDATNGNIPKLRDRLFMLGKNLGRWVLGFAVDVGSNLVAEALIRIIGI